MLTTVVVVVLVLLAAAWTFGSVTLRVGGLLATVLGSMLAIIGAPDGVPLVISGGVAWLTGHWLYAARHHAYRSPLARCIYTQLLPARLDPTHGWALPTTPVESQSPPARDARSRRQP